MSDIKYPGIEVQLIGEDGNAFFIVGRVIRAMKHEGVPMEVLNEFRAEALSGDYNHVLNTVQKYVSIY